MLFLNEFFVDLAFQIEDEVFSWYALITSDKMKGQVGNSVFERETENAVVELKRLLFACVLLDVVSRAAEYIKYGHGLCLQRLFQSVEFSLIDKAESV